MATRYQDISKEIDRAEQSILGTVRNGQGASISPRDVIRVAVDDGNRESVVRSALWFLLDKDAIVLTDDRKLQVVPKP